MCVQHFLLLSVILNGHFADRMYLIFTHQVTFSSNIFIFPQGWFDQKINGNKDFLPQIFSSHFLYFSNFQQCQNFVKKFQMTIFELAEMFSWWIELRRWPVLKFQIFIWSSKLRVMSKFFWRTIWRAADWNWKNKYWINIINYWVD